MYNNIEIANEQANQLAFGLYNGIQSFIQENKDKYIEWLLEESCKRIIIGLDYFYMIEESYKYQLCQY